MRAESIMTNTKEGIHFVQLCSNPIDFDPVSSTVSVFYDDANQHLFVVRSNGAGGIFVFDNNGKQLTFRIESRGDIFAIRLSPSCKVLSIQRSPNAIDFINSPESRKDSSLFCQTCKGKTSRITDFFWVTDVEIIFVTDLGLEFYEVDADKRTVKCTKTISIGHINWSLWHIFSKVLIVSSGVYGNVLYPFQYENGTLTRYSKLDIELSHCPIEPKLALLRRDVVLARLYSDTYIIVLKQDSSSSQVAEVLLYKTSKDQTVCKTNVLKLTSGGLFQLNIVDSLIIVHHLQSKTSFLYDIKFASVSNQQLSIHQQPLIAPLPLKAMSQKTAYLSTLSGAKAYEMYSSSWIVFQPDVIIDAVRGTMWKVELNLSAFPFMIADRCLLVKVLLHRTGAKELILSLLRDMIRPETASTLSCIGESFNTINQVYAYNEDKNEDFEVVNMTSTAASDAVVIIQQDDVYTHVFSAVFCDSGITYNNKAFPVAVMMEYFNSLQSYCLSIHFYLYELLVNMLVKCGDFLKLHQFLQYHVMSDSKHLACLLLSIQKSYPPANQIALDMLKRLGTAQDQIVEVFLTNNQVLTAIQYLKSIGNTEKLVPRKFLSVAKEGGDPDIFYITYKFFEDTYLKPKKLTSFAPSDQCQEYELFYNLLFSDPAESETQ